MSDNIDAAVHQYLEDRQEKPTLIPPAPIESGIQEIASSMGRDERAYYEAVIVGLRKQAEDLSVERTFLMGDLELAKALEKRVQQLVVDHAAIVEKTDCLERGYRRGMLASRSRLRALAIRLGVDSAHPRFADDEWVHEVIDRTIVALFKTWHPAHVARLVADVVATVP